MHLIFVVKYRKKLLNGSLNEHMLQKLFDIKKESTIYIWKKYKQFLKTHFWKEHTFWSDGYFVASIGNDNEKTIQKYIAEQSNE